MIFTPSSGHPPVELDEGQRKRTIVIIGAGPSGLASLKVVLDSQEWKDGRWDVVVFEARQEVGGIWLPASSTHPLANNQDVRRIPSPLTPLYDSLTTNIPHPLMAYSGFPFPPSTPLFPKAEVVEKYLKSYALTFGLYKYIRFNERVVKVDCDHGTGRWVVQTSASSSTCTYTSDLLLICNGHHSKPRYPCIPGIDAWLATNRAAHSIFYRSPDCAPWKLENNAKVLIVGGGPSGQDLVTDLKMGNRVKEVLHSASYFKGEVLEDGVKRRGRLVKLGDLNLGKVEFEGGIIEEGIDFVIFATGYEVQFPFLPETFVKVGTSPPVPPISQGVWNTSYGLFPLMQYLCPFTFATSDADKAWIPPSPTSIFFLGLLIRVVPMPLVEAQAKAALAIFGNKVNLNWKQEIEQVVQRYKDLEARLGQERIHKAYFRFEPMEQFDYRDALTELAGDILRVQPWEREMYYLKDVMRKNWRELEANGVAEEWLQYVGEGKTGQSAEEEWVELMRRVVFKDT